MMKVPILDEARVGQGRLPGYQPATIRPDNALSEGIAALGRGLQVVGRGADQAVGSLIEAQQAKEEKAKKEAEALAGSEAMLEFTGQAEPMIGEYKKLRGLQASEGSAKTLEELAAARKRTAEKLASPTARNHFMLRSAESMMMYRRQVEAHTEREFEIAREAAPKARMDQAIGMAEAGVPDFESWLVVSRGVEQDVKANARSPEEAEANIAQFRSASGLALVKGLIAQRRFDDADRYTQESRASLAGNFGDAVKLVDEAKKGAARDALQFSAQALVSRTADSARNAYGFIEQGDENKLREAVDGTYPENKKEMSTVAEHAINIEGERRTSTIKAWTQEAKTARLHGGTQAIPADLLARLEKYNPDYVEAIKEDDRRKWERAEAKRRGGDADKKTKNAQAAINKLALTRMQALPFAQQATFEEDVGFDALGLDEQGKADLAKQQQKARNFVGKGFDRAKEAIDNDVKAAMSAKTLKAAPEGTLFELKADANSELELFLEKNGRPPDADERAKIVAAVTLKQATKPRSILGISLPPGKEYHFEAKKREGAGSPSGPGAKPASTAEQRAVDWAKAHPNDPRSAAILKKLGVR